MTFAKYINKLAVSCGGDRNEIEAAILADLRAHDGTLRDLVVQEAMLIVHISEDRDRRQGL
jgi:hypothetical protein